MGDTAAGGDREDSNRAAEGELVVDHPGVRWLVVASVDMGTERVAQVGSCCSPWRQERGSRKELSKVARTSAHQVVGNIINSRVQQYKIQCIQCARVHFLRDVDG